MRQKQGRQLDGNLKKKNEEIMLSFLSAFKVPTALTKRRYRYLNSQTRQTIEMVPFTLHEYCALKIRRQIRRNPRRVGASKLLSTANKIGFAKQNIINLLNSTFSLRQAQTKQRQFEFLSDHHRRNFRRRGVSPQMFFKEGGGGIFSHFFAVFLC